MFFVEPTNRFLDLDEPFMWTLGDQVAEETHTKTHSVPRVQFEVKVLTSVQSRSGPVPLANLSHFKRNCFRGEACLPEKVREESKKESWMVMCDFSLSLIQPFDSCL